VAHPVPFSNDSLLAEWVSFVPNLEFTIRVFKYVLIDLTKKLRRSNTIIWGHERPGAMAAYVVAKALQLPLVTSFEGTVLYPWLERKGRFLTFLRFPLDVLATSIPADLIVMTNDGTHGDKVLRILGHSPQKILYLPNGIAAEELAKVRPMPRETLGISANELLFVVVSRLDSWKRVDRALYVAAALKSMEVKFKLVIIGDGPERERLESLSKMLSLSDVVRFEGALPNSTALSIIASADMLWSFCDYSNLTNSVQEAIGLGVPVLTIADGSMDGYTQWPGIWSVPLSDGFVEEAAHTVLVAIARAKDLDPPEKVPTWEDRGRKIAERLRELLASQQIGSG
jgi:glycosyltransferase involved in cell wall biosynthesis